MTLRLGMVIFVLLLGESVWSQKVENTLSWDKCVELALAHNQDYKLLLVSMEQVEGRILSDRSKFLPKVAANGLTLPPTLVLSFTQVEFTPAMLHVGKAFQAGRSASAINAQLTLIEMINKLRVAYAKALFAEKTIAIMQKRVDLLQDRYRRTESLFNAGNSTKDQILSVQVKLGIAQNDLKSAYTESQISRVELAEVIGLGAGDTKLEGRLEGDFWNQLPAEMDVSKLVAYAYEHRLDVKILEQLKLLADENIRITASAAYPVVGAGGSLFMSSRPKFLDPVLDAMNPQSAEKDDDDNDIQNSRATIAQVVTWKIYDGGQTLGNIRQARADAVKQDVLLKKIKAMIPSQVDVAIKAVQSARRLVDQLEKNVGPADSLRLSQNAFDAGQASQLEVLDAQQDYIIHQQATLNAKYTLDLALAQLDRVIGDKVVILDESATKRDSVAKVTP